MVGGVYGASPRGEARWSSGQWGKGAQAPPVAQLWSARYVPGTGTGAGLELCRGLRLRFQLPGGGPTRKPSCLRARRRYLRTTAGDSRRRSNRRRQCPPPRARRPGVAPGSRSRCWRERTPSARQVPADLPAAVAVPGGGLGLVCWTANAERLRPSAAEHLVLMLPGDGGPAVQEPRSRRQKARIPWTAGGPRLARARRRRGRSPRDAKAG